MLTRRLQYELAGRVAFPALVQLERWQKGKHTPRAKSPFGPPLEAGRKLKELMSLHYFQGRYADGAVPVAWVTSGFPVELLRPYNYHVVYPENHGALCSARRMTPELSHLAEQEGYSPDLCGYARADIGGVLGGPTPVGRLPKPDLLCCCTNICQTVLYWYRSLAAHFGVPLVVVDTPFVYGEAPQHHLDYVEAQLGEAMEAAAAVVGKRAEPEALGPTLERAKEGVRLWGECLALGQHKPSPWTGFDGFVHMAPIVALRGTEACNAYYRLLRDELQERAARGIGGIETERVRLLWDNLPVWYKIRELSTAFAEAGANFVCTTYTNAWAEVGGLLEPASALSSLAKAYTYVLLNRDLPNRLAVMRDLCERYDCQGAVLHSDRSCKPYSMGQLDLKQRLRDELGIKVLVVEADHADPRAYAEEQVATRVAAFLESLA